jgi:hypothetical protein
MMTEVYIIRKGLDKFFMLNPEGDNWTWESDMDDATIFLTPEKAEEVRLQRKTGNDSYVYQMPYSVPSPQQRKKKPYKKPKRKIKSRVIKKGKPVKRK